MSEKILPLPPSRQTLTDSVYEAVTELVVDQHIQAGARGAGDAAETAMLDHITRSKERSEEARKRATRPT